MRTWPKFESEERAQSCQLGHSRLVNVARSIGETSRESIETNQIWLRTAAAIHLVLAMRTRDDIGRSRTRPSGCAGV